MPVKCIYIKGLDIVIQKIIEYERYDSCVQRVKPSRIKVPLLGSPERIQQAQLYCDSFENQHGLIKSYWIIYKNRSNHDTYYFEKLLKNGVKKYEK
jgi:hypothetical protein